LVRLFLCSGGKIAHLYCFGIRGLVVACLTPKKPYHTAYGTVFFHYPSFQASLKLSNKKSPANFIGKAFSL